ncbi:hypothetical protein COLO4_32268 [Corchorus olitorius]|uniref:Uncharacterized protein n=1 Tax=Corchorus olitorius TaxID=93759 RepID=A0A1R3GZX5_9ROSI|nr:hypothetical protein COLO4_32268 [Corchorus olitorius]
MSWPNPIMSWISAQLLSILQALKASESSRLAKNHQEAKVIGLLVIE